MMKSRGWSRMAVVAAFLTCIAVAGYGQPYSGFHAFGSSLVDVGNITYVTGGSIPPSPPYLLGRFSNGPNFADVAAENLDLGPLAPSMNGGTNHAWGGALSLGPPPSVRGQVEGYLAGAGGAADPDALYLLEGGGNDISAALWSFVGAGDWEGAVDFVESAALGMVESVQMLVAHGAVHVVILNAAYFSETAWFCGDPQADLLVEHFNSTLEAGLSALPGGLRVVRFDLAEFGRSVSEHFITRCEYCVPFLLADPVCSDPDVLFYWDEVHFSAQVHQLIGDAITAVVLEDEVRHLRALGILGQGRANALLTKLDGAYEKLAERQPRPAVNKVRAFVHQVKAFVHGGHLTPEQADLLLVGAQGIIDQP